jgi:hypothetical protein
MPVVVLDRFSDPSRWCDPADFAADATVWRLPPHTRPAALVGRFPRALRLWLSGIPRAEQRELLRACLRTPGARAGALVTAPEAWRAVRRGGFDHVGCFSAKDFGLVNHLATLTARAPIEAIAHRTRYFGEFGFELFAVLPYAYWLQKQGLLEGTAGVADTRCLYYFSPSHEEHAVPRRYVPITEWPVGERGHLRYDARRHPAVPDLSRWTPPPYRQIYADPRFRWQHPTCVVLNKASSERYLRRGFLVNALDRELLFAVVRRLRERYQIVYDRPRAVDIVNDHQQVRETGDLQALKAAYPDVITIQELHDAHPELTFNELQLRVFAGCERFVSVLGGGSYLASYFGGTNVVYARRGWEVQTSAFERWFDAFSGARVIPAAAPEELIRTVERELLT